jgi:diguanylate cyclase (GGDEF)-like protein
MMLTIHIETIIIALIAGHIVTGLLGGLYLARRKKDVTFYTFLLARLCDALAWALLELGERLPNQLLILTGSSLLMFGSALQIIAFFSVKEHLTPQVKRICGWVVVVFLILLPLALSFFGSGHNIRTAVASFSLAVFWSIPVYSSIHDKRASPLQKLITYVYGVWIVLLIFKTFEVLYFYIPVTPATGNAYHILFFLWLYLVMLTGNIGLVLLSKEKSDRILTRAATYDELTDLYNRRAFFLRAKECISFCARQKIPISFLIMDLDHFKKINDFYGHMMGDLVLKSFASTLKKQLRGYDVLGRIGGEEFTALLPGVGEREAYGIAQRVRSSVEGTAVNHTIKYTVSIGVSTLVPSENTTIDHLYRLGDHALYQAKQNGRNQVCAAKAD